MKKVFFIALCVMTASTAFSQINKGQWMVGGNASFSSSKFEDADNTTNTYQLAPNAGYFFINNLVGGFRINLSGTKTETELGDFKSSSVLVSPFVRYYFLPAAEKINVFADLGYGFGSEKAEIGNNDETASVSGFSIAAGPAIFITPNTALELTVGYNSLKYEDVSERYNTLQVGVGFQIHLGAAKK